jgi:hypothetical protein
MIIEEDELHLFLLKVRKAIQYLQNITFVAEIFLTMECSFLLPGVRVEDKKSRPG